MPAIKVSNPAQENALSSQSYFSITPKILQVTPKKNCVARLTKLTYEKEKKFSAKLKFSQANETPQLRVK